jgi:ferredoxin
VIQWVAAGPCPPGNLPGVATQRKAAQPDDEGYAGMVTMGLIILGLAILLGLGAFGVSARAEGERRAARIALGAAVALSVPFFLSGWLPQQGQRVVLLGVAGVGVVGVLLFLLPVGRVERGNDVPRVQVDERDTMFARVRLEPGSPEYAAYYALRPENQAGDDRTRSLPGLLSSDASEANALVFAAADASFAFSEALHGVVNGPVVQEPAPHAAAPMSAYVKGLARHLGARAVGITALRPYHVYSHVGRGAGEWGAPIALRHRYAVAFTVEMDHALIWTAPGAATVLESAHQYATAAKIAVELGTLMRSLGYPARAHIDGNYRVIAPLVARDAGLGEIGRMGLLMTPDLGPRVRLAVVTTDLPLVPDPRSDELSVLDFCRLCLKCADNCPVRAIRFGERQEIDGALRWQIDAESCFRYWNVTGTDCGRCMAVCPYSYPDSPTHNLVRWAVRRSGVARRAVLRLDRLFYGAYPPPKPPPAWMPPRSAGG